MKQNSYIGRVHSVMYLIMSFAPTKPKIHVWILSVAVANLFEMLGTGCLVTVMVVNLGNLPSNVVYIERLQVGGVTNGQPSEVLY